MRSILVLALLFAGGAAAQPVARLDGWAVLPAETIIAAPGDAGADLRAAGKFTQSDRPRPAGPSTMKLDGGALPAAGQVVQGFSALRGAGDGSFWALSDNGFGAKANSPDAMLMLHRLQIDWAAQRTRILETVFLSDPQAIAPFRIAQEGAATRYLTGADFDPESLVVRADGGFVIGDEFGPYLLGFDAAGRLQWVVETTIDGRTVRSPDNPKQGVPDAGDISRAEVRRSRGFEGLTAGADGKTLYAMLEGPVRNQGAPEAGLRILAFDLAAEKWTGQSWLYALEAPSHAIGEIALIAPDRALVIERDGGQGLATTACRPEPPNVASVRPPFPSCHPDPARFKRVFVVDLPKEGGGAHKRASIDLLAIADPKRQAPSTAKDGRFSFPFQTIEAIEPLADGRLLIANDNNYPFSDGRRPAYLDATEFILLTPPADFLKP